MAQTLLPRPFCGGEPSFERLGTPRQSCIVACGNCGARHESSDEDERNGASWNTRAGRAEAAQRVIDAARAAMDASKDYDDIIGVPDDLAASLSLALDEYDALEAYRALVAAAPGASQAAPTAQGWAVERAADMLTAYTELVKATGRYAEEHYIPEVEEVIEALRVAAATATEPKGAPDAQE